MVLRRVKLARLGPAVCRLSRFTSLVSARVFLGAALRKSGRRAMLALMVGVGRGVGDEEIAMSFCDLL